MNLHTNTRSVDVFRSNWQWEIQDVGLQTSKLLSKLSDQLSTKFQRLHRCVAVLAIQWQLREYCMAEPELLFAWQPQIGNTHISAR